MLGIIASSVATSLASFAGGLLYDGAKSFASGTAGKIVSHYKGEVLARVAGSFGLATNHDAEKAIRRAQMAALRYLMTQYSRNAPREDEAGGRVLLDFIDAGFAFADEATRKCDAATIAIKEEVIGEIEKSLDATLGAVPVEAIEARAETLRAAAAQAVFEELTDAIARRKVPETGEPVAVPAGFRDLFFHGGTSYSEEPIENWYGAFELQAADALKGSNPKFAKAFIASRLGGISELSFDTNAMVRTIVEQSGLLAERNGNRLDDMRDAIDSMRVELADWHRQNMAAHQETHDKLDDLQAMVAQLLANSSVKTAPGQDEAVRQVVAFAEKGANEGDERLRQALECLARQDIAGAEKLFRLVAQEKDASIRRDHTEAALAYRNLAAIAGLRDPKAAYEAYVKALEHDPDDLESLYWAGYFQIERGDLRAAAEKLSRVLKLVSEDAAGQTFYRFWALTGLGDVFVAQGNLPDALKSFRDGLVIREGLARSDPGHADWQRDLSVSYDRIGDVFVAQGNLTAALKSFRDGLVIREGLARSDPGHADWQRDLSVSYDRIGDVFVAQGNLTDALKSFRDGLVIREGLARSDPGNAGWQRDVSVSYNRIGDVLVEQGNLTDALKSFRDGLAIADRLARSDPGNAGWQRDLSVSYNRIGDVLVEQGNLTDALKSFRDGLAIADRLARSDPGNAGWQRDLSVSYNKVGEVFVAQGNLTDALKSFRAGLAIADSLARSDPGNAGWQRDVSVSYDRIGDVLVAQGNLPDALKSFRDGLVIREGLARSDPGHAGWQRDVSVSYNKIGDVFVAQDNLLNALTSFRDGLVIREGLARSDPGNAGWQRDLFVSHAKIGMAELAGGNGDAACARFEQAKSVIASVLDKVGDHYAWRQDLHWIDNILALHCAGRET